MGLPLPRLCLVSLLIGLGGACSAPGVLVAPGGEHRSTARDPTSGVTVVLTTGVWPGRPFNLDERWTTIHILVANLGDAPILLAPGDLALYDERGFGYELLDVGAAFEPVLESDRTTVYDRVYHRDYDPGGPVEFEPVVPLGNTAEQALPWGTLEPNTQMRGFIYFEPIERSANNATLTWSMIRPDHSSVVDLRFDLRIARLDRD